DPVDGVAREDGGGGGDPHRLRPFGPDQLGGVHDRAGGVDHVVDDHRVLAFHVPGDVEGGGDVVELGFPPLVDDGDGSVETAGVLLGPLHASGVRGDDGHRAGDPLPQVVGDDRQGGEVVE